MKRVAPGIFTGNMGQFGDDAALRADGVQVAIACGFKVAGPHAGDIVTLVVNPPGDGILPDAQFKALCAGLAKAVDGFVYAVCDANGGEGPGAYLLAAVRCEASQVNFATALAWLRANALGPGVDLPPNHKTQGARLWP